MSKLDLIFDKIKEYKTRGLKPLVVFDLDDTLIDCRYRKRFVLREFCALESSQKSWPEYCQKVLDANLEDYEYKVSDFLKNLNISNSKFLKEMEAYWLSKYFTNEYLAADEFFPNAIASLEKMRSLGATIKYFTGRDAPGMREGTIKKLNEHGLADELTMKPDKETSDVSFKTDYFALVTEGFDLVCFFENELKNLHPFVEKYPDALFVWLDTLHSPNQPIKNEKIITLKNWDC